MATAADLTIPTDEPRELPGVMTNFAGLFMVAGAVALMVLAAVAKAAAGDDPTVLSRFWHAYLLSAVTVASFSMGGLFFVLAHHLTGGRWGTSVRRLAEIVAGTMILSAAMFAPIVVNVLLGSGDLYPWNDADYLATHSVVQKKLAYLNPEFFAIRTVIYFVLLLLITRYFVKKSVKQDETGDLATLRKLSKWSGPSMLVFALTLNFAAFDWLMSLEPTWFSTMFGVYFFSGSAVGFLSLLILMVNLLGDRGVLSQCVTVDNRQDIAKLLYGFIVFWGYITFSQFLLIWYANIPEETEWFFHRQSSEPSWVGMAWDLRILFILHLFIPFIGFMSRTVRRNRAAMTFWAIYLLVVHWLDLVFIVMPSTEGAHGTSPFNLIGVYEIVGLLAAAAILVGGILWQADGRWLVPLRDPRLKQARTYHNH